MRRAPWAAGLIAALLGPVIGMLYLGRGWSALAYFVAVPVFGAAAVAGAHFGLLPLGLEACLYLAIGLWWVAGFAHAILAAARRSRGRPDRWWARWYVLAALVLANWLSAPVLRAVWFEPFTIPSVSMSPALSPGDYIFVSKSGGVEPAPGQVVAYWDAGIGTVFIKRIVATAGQSVQYRGGRLYVDGVMVERTPDGAFTPEPAYGGAEISRYRETLPGGASYFILEAADDGVADETQVYEVPAGHVFLLGDNRDDSMDSRHRGTVPIEDVLGPVTVRLWDGREGKFGIHRVR